MTARRTAAQIALPGISSEFGRVAVHPSDRPAALIDERKQIALGCVHVREVDGNEMRAGVDIGFGIKSEIRRASAAPTSAVEINQYRRIRPLGLPDIDAFNRGGPIGESFGLADGRGCDRLASLRASNDV